MPRPRAFDYDQSLNQAMYMFWDKGYKSTSLQDLLETMEISKSSFYDAFGDKRQLFLSALQVYTRLTTERMLKCLQGKGSFIERLEGILQRIIETALSSGGRRGCLIANSAIELSPHDRKVERMVAAELKRIEDAYCKAIALAQKGGEIAKDKDARALARFIVCNLNGLVVISKAIPDRATLLDIKRTVIAALR